jgi:hypothetical protein
MLTDDGSQVTDCFATKDKKPNGKYAFDEAAPRSPSNAGWHRRVTRKRMVWLNALMVALTN